MSKEIKIAIWVAAVALVAYFVQRETAPAASPVQPPKKNWAKGQKAGGDVWQRPFVAAQSADDGNAWPPAPLM